MSDIEPPKSEIARRMQELWQAYRQIELTRGLDIEEALAAWTVKERQRLAFPGSRDDFDELCKGGCVPQVLALLIAFVRSSPRISERFRVLGSPDKREKTVRSLERASEACQDLFENLLTLDHELIAIAFPEKGMLPQPLLVTELRLYAGLLKLAAMVPSAFEVNSLPEFTKFLLVGYVEQATGRFYDRNVSVLIGDALGPADYHEVAQRMWRHRNYQRLKESLQGLPELLFDLSFVMARRT
jgi:hypothetical protein